MLFNSIHFLLFLFVTLAAFSIAPVRLRKYILLLASFYFYASWSVAYLVLILFVIIVTYLLAFVIVRPHGKKYLLIAITSILAVLAIFKYGNFTIVNGNKLLHAVDINYQFDILAILLPVGISFYTFQAISYVIDVYRGDVLPEKNVVDYALYISFFPQLVAGPIERSFNILPQIKNNLASLPTNLLPGLSLIFSGFIKKVVIADRLALFVDRVYVDPQAASSEEIIVAVYFFAFQIYCDFSGYTDIARGTARLFNIKLMENFNKPYFSSSLREFWRRWHISLSTWFRDYLYIPLGGSRMARSRTLVNLLVVFLLCGLWHGAGYTFILWGGLHGVVLLGQTVVGTRPSSGQLKKNRLITVLATVFTFHLVTLLWVFFRSDSIDDVPVIMAKLISLGDIGVFRDLLWTNFENRLGLIFIVLLLLFEGFDVARRVREKTAWRKPMEVAYHLISFYIIIAFGVFDVRSFIYFQF